MRSYPREDEGGLAKNYDLFEQGGVWAENGVQERAPLRVDPVADVDAVLIGSPAHEGPGYIAAMADVLGSTHKSFAPSGTHTLDDL